MGFNSEFKGLILIGLYVLYKWYNCFKGKVSCVKTITDTNGSVVNIKIHTSNENLELAQKDVPWHKRMCHYVN